MSEEKLATAGASSCSTDEGKHAINSQLAANLKSFQLPIKSHVFTHSGISELEAESALGRRVTRKCDIRLVPVLGGLYFTAFLDRVNIANAKLNGFEKDLNMPDNGYNTALWVFFLSFVLLEVPCNIFLNWHKMKPNRWLGLMMFLLGKSNSSPRYWSKLPIGHCFNARRHCFNVPRTDKICWRSLRLSLHYGCFRRQSCPRCSVAHGPILPPSRIRCSFCLFLCHGTCQYRH